MDLKSFARALSDAAGQDLDVSVSGAIQKDRSHSTGSVQAGSRSYVTINERICEPEYQHVIRTLMKGAMRTEECKWEPVEESPWDHKLTSHDSVNDWQQLFQKGLPQGKCANASDLRLVKELQRSGQTLCWLYLMSHRHDPEGLRAKLAKQQRASRTGKHEGWHQNRLIQIIGQCRNLHGADESDDGDKRWYVVGLGDVFCPGDDRCDCPPGMIKIKAEWVGRRWYQKTVPQAPAADCSAGGDERGGERQLPCRHVEQQRREKTICRICVR